MSNLISTYYDKDYFRWQSGVGEFGGWANRTKFDGYISANDRVLDFGCGGGFLLAGLQCSARIGVEVNPDAMQAARDNGVQVFGSVAELPDDCADIVVSNNALEHTLQPLSELISLRDKVRPGGLLVFVVPCESISYFYRAGDINHHLYSWSPMCIGNLFGEAGFEVLSSEPYIHKWPPGYRHIARFGGRRVFDLACRIYGRIARRWHQVRVVARRPGSPDAVRE